MRTNVLTGLGSRKLVFSLRALLSAGVLTLLSACGGAARPAANSPTDGISVVGQPAPESVPTWATLPKALQDCYAGLAAH